MKILAKLGSLAILLVFTYLTTSCDQPLIMFESNDLEISINKKAELVSLYSKQLQKEFIAQNQKSNLLSIRVKW